MEQRTENDDKEDISFYHKSDLLSSEEVTFVIILARTLFSKSISYGLQIRIISLGSRQ